MWKFVGDTKGLEPLPGIPLESSDADFEEALKAYGDGTDEEAKAVKASGLYKHEQTKDKAPAAPEA